MRERERLIARIRQIRRVAAATEKPARSDPDVSRLDALETRMAHLEQLLEGLQDSVYRESERQGKLIGELQAQIQPGAVRASLHKDARARGL